MCRVYRHLYVLARVQMEQKHDAGMQVNKYAILTVSLSQTILNT